MAAQLYPSLFSIRKALSCVLKVVSVFESLTHCGKSFHSLGPRPVRDRPPLSVWLKGTCRLCFFRVVQVWRETSLCGGRRIYHSGKSSFVTLYTWTATSKITFSSTLSHPSRAMKGGMIAPLAPPPRVLAAKFCSRCTCCGSVAVVAPQTGRQ